MLSSDKNISIVTRLIELAKHYIGLQNEYLKLGAIEKVVRLSVALIIAVTLALIIFMILIFLSFAVAMALASWVGHAAAFFIVGIFYVLAFLAFLAFRKPLLEKPLVEFLTSLLME